MNYKLNPKRKKSIADKILVLIFLAVCLTAAVMPIPNASAAEVFIKDQDLEGSVVGVTAEGVEFETIYGKGAIVIPWVDFKIAVYNTYNNRPPDDTERNTFTTTAGLSFRF